MAQGFAKAHPRLHRRGRRGHDVFDTVPEREAVDAGERAQLRIPHPLGCNDGMPADLRLLVRLRCERKAGPLRLGQRRDALLRQARNQCGIDRRRGPRVAQRPVALFDPDIQPARYRVERRLPGAEWQQRGELPDAERPVGTPRQRMAVVLRLEHGEVEPDRIADHDARADPARQRGQDLAGRFRRAQVLVGDAVDGRRGGRDRNAGVDDPVECPACVNGAAAEPDRAHLDDPVARGVEAGRFGVERNRLQGRQGNGAQSCIFLPRDHGRTLPFLFRAFGTKRYAERSPGKLLRRPAAAKNPRGGT